jgi:hypothetical protein
LEYTVRDDNNRLITVTLTADADETAAADAVAKAFDWWIITPTWFHVEHRRMFVTETKEIPLRD